MIACVSQLSTLLIMIILIIIEAHVRVAHGVPVRPALKLLLLSLSIDRLNHRPSPSQSSQSSGSSMIIIIWDGDAPGTSSRPSRWRRPPPSAAARPAGPIQLIDRSLASVHCLHNNNDNDNNIGGLTCRSKCNSVNRSIACVSPLPTTIMIMTIIII